MKTLTTILLSAFLLLPIQANAKERLIHCPLYVTHDIKPRKAAIRSCDTFYITKTGKVRRIPKIIRNRYTWELQ